MEELARKIHARTVTVACSYLGHIIRLLGAYTILLDITSRSSCNRNSSVPRLGVLGPSPSPISLIAINSIGTCLVPILRRQTLTRRRCCDGARGHARRRWLRGGYVRPAPAYDSGSEAGRAGCASWVYSVQCSFRSRCSRNTLKSGDTARWSGFAAVYDRGYARGYILGHVARIQGPVRCRRRSHVFAGCCSCFFSSVQWLQHGADYILRSWMASSFLRPNSKP
ncbi:hypothetical protein B0H13DRAFT_62164 [Mycena leptocephala]|nr:hypothetical protein B0H13DRAFT_62164 [Mycena leptocephala]